MTANILLVKLDLPMTLAETPYLRGIIIHKSDANSNPLFHGHEGDGFRYSYPQVQYKCLDGNGALIMLSTEKDLGPEDLPTLPNGLIQLGRRRVQASVDGIFKAESELGIIEGVRTYDIKDYLPFNQENYDVFRKTRGIVDRMRQIEQTLTANILSMYKGLGLHIEEHVDVCLEDVKRCQPAPYKGVKMVRFNARFSANVALPPLAGLGKGVSIGYGTVTEHEDKQE